MSILAPPVHEPAHIEAAKQNAPAGKRNYLVGESISIVCYKMPFFHVQYNLLQINALDLVCPKTNHPQTHQTHKKHFLFEPNIAGIITIFVLIVVLNFTT